jgi:hypothetical protein
MSATFNINRRKSIVAVVEVCDDERIVLENCIDGHDSTFELKRESFHPSIGWYVQQTMSLNREELVGLKAALGVRTPRACQRISNAAVSEAATTSPEPAILKFPVSNRTER